MADIQYLNYGDLQIDLLALMTNMANLVLNYVNSQPWSSKRKNMFMSAYSDIIGHGILGASNNTGQWTIDVNGTDLNLSGKSKKEQEMYGEAAYFIQQLMQGLVSDAETKKEEEKKDLPLFDNAYFNKRLKETISKDRFGGGEILWGSLDNNERDSLGRRSVAGRTNQLIESLSKLSDSLKEGEYNFENSPYENLGDFKNRINTAIEALKKDPYSAREALERLGLNYDTYLSTEENEDSGLTDKDGNPLTYAQYAEQLSKQEEAKLQLLALDALKKANALKGVLSITLGIHANEARYKGKEYQEWLANTYGTGLKGFNAINNRIQELLNKAYNSNERGKGLTSSDKKELGNLLYMLRLNPNYKKSNVSLEELEELKKYLHFDKSASNLIRLPFQNSEGRYTYADDKGNIYYLKPNQGKKFGNLKGTDSNYKNNFLQGTNIMNIQQRDKYLKSSKEGLTSAEWEELASIGFDIASIVDPEMISSAGLALTGSGLRHHALASLPGGMSTSDKWWQAADYGLSILGSVPVFGDAALLYRATNRLKKAIYPLGILMAGANVPQAAKAAYNKVVNGQDLTIQDWRAIGGVLTAAVGMGRGRQMAKRAEALRRTGGNTAKTINEGKILTTQGEIKVDESTAKLLKQEFGKLDGATRTQKLRENAKVKEAAQKQGIDLSKAEVAGYKKVGSGPISTSKGTTTTSGNRIATLRAMSLFNLNHGWLARKGLAEQDWVFRKTGGYESTPTTNYWKGIKDFFTKSEWDNFGVNKSSNNVSTPSNTTQTTPTTVQNVRETNYNRAVAKRYKNVLSENFSKNKVQEGEFEFNGVTYKVSKNKKGKFTITNNNPVSSENPRFLKSNLSEQSVKKQIAKIVQESRKNPNGTKKSTKEIGKILQDLKRKGWLKQGGKITDTQIDNFLKQYK